MYLTFFYYVIYKFHYYCRMKILLILLLFFPLISFSQVWIGDYRNYEKIIGCSLNPSTFE